MCYALNNTKIKIHNKKSGYNIFHNCWHYLLLLGEIYVFMKKKKKKVSNSSVIILLIQMWMFGLVLSI